MTPERFQSRDTKRRLTALENQRDYLKADLTRALARISRVEDLAQELLALWSKRQR